MRLRCLLCCCLLCCNLLLLLHLQLLTLHFMLLLKREQVDVVRELCCFDLLISDVLLLLSLRICLQLSLIKLKSGLIGLRLALSFSELSLNQRLH